MSIRIDIVSDVACPWCAVGLASLERALERLGNSVSVELHFQPFELNPNMSPEGEDATQHLMKKYGLSEAQVVANRDRIRDRGAEVGFEFHPMGRGRVHNTFKAHLLLQWAEESQVPGAQLKLKKAFLRAHQGQALNINDDQVLLDCVALAGLDTAQAQDALKQPGVLTQTVRERQDHYRQAGIQSVPAFIFDQQYLISGGQPVEVFEQALMQLSASNPTSSST